MIIGLHSALHFRLRVLIHFRFRVSINRVWLSRASQVAGFKLVRLYLESDTPYMYRFAGSSDGASRHAQGNFSAVDVEDPNLARFPDFANATPYDVILAPGDFVYIPAKCWHYVRSLTPSISLNFWF